MSEGNSLAGVGLSQQGLTGGEGSGTQRKRGTRTKRGKEGGGGHTSRVAMGTEAGDLVVSEGQNRETDKKKHPLHSSFGNASLTYLIYSRVRWCDVKQKKGS